MLWPWISRSEQAEPDEDLFRTRIFGKVKLGKGLQLLEFFRQPSEYGSFMCLLNCAHYHLANVELVQKSTTRPSVDGTSEVATVEGWMIIRIAIRGGKEMAWEYGGSTDVESEAIPCCCGATPGVQCWVVVYQPPKPPAKKRLKSS